jgi:hypothetical protein
LSRLLVFGILDVYCNIIFLIFVVTRGMGLVLSILIFPEVRNEER